MTIILGYFWVGVAWTVIVLLVGKAGYDRVKYGPYRPDGDDVPDLSTWTDESQAWHRKQAALQRTTRGGAA